MAKDNGNLIEPKSLTRCGIWSLHRTNLIVWATSQGLLDPQVDMAKWNKERLVVSCQRAIGQAVASLRLV